MYIMTRPNIPRKRTPRWTLDRPGTVIGLAFTLHAESIGDYEYVLNIMVGARIWHLGLFPRND